MYIKLFKVVTISKNTNSFGLYGVIIMAKDGQAYQIAVSHLYKPEKGDVLSAYVSENTGKLLRIISINHELQEELPTAPMDVVKEVWSEKFATINELT
jgi:hypothetical protein